MGFLSRASLVLSSGLFFFLWHWPLFSPAGRVRGFNSDAAVIALMAKKMFDGRGFDFFFWGQNYVGPLTSLFIAGAGVVTGAVDPLAMRLGTLAELFLGMIVTAWAVQRVDRRAAAATLVALLLTPPVILRMLVTPLGAEMAFPMSALLLAVLMQHLTAPPERGVLRNRRGQVFFGLLAGVSWWMNQQVVFVLLAGIVVLLLRSEIARRVWIGIRVRDRLLFRDPMPGWLEALAWVLSGAGTLLFAAFMIHDLSGALELPFVFGRVLDPLILLLLPQLLVPPVRGEWRQWRLPITGRARYEMAAAFLFAAGFLVGYSPVLLGGIFGWYDESYTFGFQLNYPSGMLLQLRALVTEMIPHWIGISHNTIGALYTLAFVVLLAAASRGVMTSQPKMLLALVPLLNVLFFVITRGGKAHYFIASIGMLLGFAALGLVALWNRSRPFATAAALIAVLSIGMSARAWHANVLAEPDPMPLLQRVRSADCAVVYADFWIAYRYRFLDGEQRAWIPYASQNRTRGESEEAQRLPGQRCRIHNDLRVELLEGDLPLKWAPPRRSR